MSAAVKRHQNAYMPQVDEAEGDGQLDSLSQDPLLSQEVVPDPEIPEGAANGNDTMEDATGNGKWDSADEQIDEEAKMISRASLQKKPSTCAMETVNTVCMMTKDKFVREGEVEDDLVIFRCFRSGPCDTKDRISWSTVKELGSAIEGKHYTKSEGIITFEKGSHMTHFSVTIGNDEKWEPIRDFVVRLGEVIEGNCVIGSLDHSVCTIVDDDLYPEKIERPTNIPRKRSEKNLPSCMHSDLYLTVDEIDDWVLAKGFITERWKATMPFSTWGGIWAAYRAFYSAGVSVVVVVFIDQVLIEPKVCPEGSIPGTDACPSDAAGIAGRITLAAILSLAVLVTKCLNAMTETYIIDNCKGALIRKHLRTWLVTQLLWADDVRLSTMRASHYLNAGTNEVDAATDLYVAIFPMIENVIRFVLNFVTICWLVPIAAPTILALLPVGIFVQWYRATATTELLVARQVAERQWVGTLSDVIENTSTFRALAACGNVAKTFEAENQEFSRTHLAALHYNTRTRQICDWFCAVALFGILMASAFLVNTGMSTPGAVVGLISAFQSSSDNVLDVSKLVLFMKFCCERLRNVTRILNFPTDAHTLAEHEQEMDKVSGMWKKMRQQNFELVEGIDTTAAPDATAFSLKAQVEATVDSPKFEDGFPKEAGKWANHICVSENTYRCSTRRALIASIAKSGKKTELKDKITILSGYVRLGGVILLKGPTDSAERTLLQLMTGTKSTQQRDNIYFPSFLNFAYVAELPTLLEGSIIHNLKCTISKIRKCKDRGEITDDEAWYVVARCGLSSDLIGAPAQFSVGKGGRNLSLGDRQAISIARAVLTDPDVLMLHHPLDFVSMGREKTLMTFLSDFVHKGGLWGIIAEMPPKEAKDGNGKDVKIDVNPAQPSKFGGHDKALPLRGKAEVFGVSPKDYLRGNGMRTVVFTQCRWETEVPPEVTRVFNLVGGDNEKQNDYIFDNDPDNMTGKHRLNQMGQQFVGGLQNVAKRAHDGTLLKKKPRSRSVGRNLSAIGAEPEKKAGDPARNHSASPSPLHRSSSPDEIVSSAISKISKAASSAGRIGSMEMEKFRGSHSPKPPSPSNRNKPSTGSAWKKRSQSHGDSLFNLGRSNP